MTSLNMLVYGKRGGRRQRRCAWGKEFRIGEPALLVISGRFAHGPSRATRARWPDLQATASAADPLDFCSLVDLYCLCYSMLPCDCDCRGCCGCRIFCWRFERCCCCCCCCCVCGVVVSIVCVVVVVVL